MIGANEGCDTQSSGPGVTPREGARLGVFLPDHSTRRLCADAVTRDFLPMEVAKLPSRWLRNPNAPANRWAALRATSTAVTAAAVVCETSATSQRIFRPRTVYSPASPQLIPPRQLPVQQTGNSRPMRHTASRISRA